MGAPSFQKARCCGESKASISKSSSLEGGQAIYTKQLGDALGPGNRFQTIGAGVGAGNLYHMAPRCNGNRKSTDAMRIRNLFQTARGCDPGARGLPQAAQRCMGGTRDVCQTAPRTNERKQSNVKEPDAPVRATNLSQTIPRCGGTRKSIPNNSQPQWQHEIYSTQIGAAVATGNVSQPGRRGNGSRTYIYIYIYIYKHSSAPQWEQETNLNQMGAAVGARDRCQPTWRYHGTGNLS